MSYESHQALVKPLWLAWSRPPLWLIGLLWLVLPVSALEYHQNWNQLPQRVAVHFNSNWQPNGYGTRKEAVDMGLGIMAALLALFTVLVLIVRALQPAVSWVMLLVFYVATGFAWYGNHSIIKFNLNPPAHSELVGPLSPVVCDSRETLASYVSTQRFS